MATCDLVCAEGRIVCAPGAENTGSGENLVGAARAEYTGVCVCVSVCAPGAENTGSGEDIWGRVGHGGREPGQRCDM